MSLRNLGTISLPAFVLALGLVQPVQADPLLPNLENLNFTQYNGATPKNSFGSVNPVGWTGGSGLIFIDQPGTSNSNPNTACGSTYLQTYGCPSTLHITGGYNYVEADGNPSFESGFNYSVSGLTVGQTYELDFYQAASQQTGFTGNTTEQWIVSLGLDGMSFGSSGPNQDYYYNNDSNASVVATNLMSTPSGGMTDWNYVQVFLTADATTDLLSFLAWGDGGSTVNEPPIVFLAGVNSPAGLQVPEPGTLALFAAGLAGLGVLMWRRRAKEKTVAS